MKNHRIQRVLIAAFCSTVFSASASDIQMFGFFDQGLAYLHEDLNAGMGGPAGQSINAPQYVDKDGYVAEAQTKRSFTQGSGNVSTWGIKGSEQINADVRVLFHLESGFLADDGIRPNLTSPQVFDSTPMLDSRSNKGFTEPP